MGAKCMKKSPSTSTAIFCGFMVGNMRSQKLLQEIYFMVSIFRMYYFTSKLVTFANNKMVSGIAVAPYIIS